MDRNAQIRAPALALMAQYIYELRKGVRQLFLLTMTPHEARAVQDRLDREGIAWHNQPVTSAKVNVYFGQPVFVELAGRLARQSLNQLTPEQDFMLGTLLGYDREQQCRRYLERGSESMHPAGLQAAL